MNGYHGRFVIMPTSDEEAFFSDEEEELEDDDYADEDEKRSIRDRAYQKYLPDLKKLVKETCGDSKIDLVADKVEKSCAVCPTTQWFKGWKALLAHAETFKKKRIQQHRGYGDAIREALKNYGSCRSQKEVSPAATRMASFHPEAAISHLIVWPPLVVVRSTDRRVDVHEAVFELLDREAPDIHKPLFIAAQGNYKLLVFRAEAVGYLEAKLVSELLSEHRSKRGWNSCIHGFLATRDDMDHIDPDRHYVEWTEESHYVKVQQAQKKDKAEHDNEKARLKEIELQVENLTENELKFKERKERFECLIDSKQKEIENQKRKADDMEKAHLKKMQNLEADFQNQIKVFEATSASRLKRWREQLQGNEERLEDERMKRMKEIEILKTQFYSLRKESKDIKQKEAEKAVERELEVMQKKKNFMAELAKAEACFNENARKKETELQEKQHLEVMKLMEEAKKEREALLQEWLEKQERERKEKENLIEEVPECCLCMDVLTEMNRAVFRPCGHAKTCLECALDVFKGRNCKCPICRTPITNEPTLLPKYYI